MVTRLESAKQAAKSPPAKAGKIIQEFDDFPFPESVGVFPNQVVIAGYVWNVQPGSICKKRLNFPYVLKSGGVVLMLNTNDCGDDLPNGWLEFGSIPLTLAHGLDRAWKELMDGLTEICIIKRHVISRVDLCIDVINMGVAKFYRKFQRGEYLTRAGKDDVHYEGVHNLQRRATGITIGRSILLNIYDKTLEVRSDPIKSDIMYNVKWLPVNDMKMPEHVTRIEFQTKREALRDYLVNGLRIDTVEDWQRHRAAIWDYLMTGFCRFVQGKPDRKNNNQHRAKTWAVWDEIRTRGVDGLLVSGGHAMSEVRREPRKGGVDLKQLNAQGVACLVKSYIFAGYDPQDLSGILGWCSEVAHTLHCTGKLEEMVKRSMLERTERIGE